MTGRRNCLIDAQTPRRFNGFMSKKAPKFEDALARLESIAEEIEGGEIGLEESIARYEEGMKLVQHCRKILDAAEQRIVEFEPDGEPPAGGGS